MTSVRSPSARLANLSAISFASDNVLSNGADQQLTALTAAWARATSPRSCSASATEIDAGRDVELQTEQTASA